MESYINTFYAALAAYGVSTLVSDYDGPFKLFFKLRSNTSRSLFECTVCLLPYTALIVMICPLWALQYLAVIGIGIILSRNL